MFIVVSGEFLFSYHFVFSWCPIIWQFSIFSQRKGAKIGFFNFLCFKFKFRCLGLPNTIKIMVLVVIFYVFAVEKEKNKAKK